MPARNSLGREFRRLRVASGMTLAELSRRTGVREAYLTAIEDDREEPSAAALRRLVRQLEPDGTSDERLDRFLTAPEFDGEYAHNGHARSGTPALPGDDRGANQQQTPEPDAVATAGEGVWRAEGRRAILTELDRRGLARPDNGVNEPLQETRVGREDLQFDRVITESTSSAPPSQVVVICAACQTSIETEYYDVNGQILCSRCRTAVESAAETPRGIIPLIIAGVFGLGAGILGAIIYYAVMAIAHLEIGIVAILIGYMVGYAVRKGVRARGGRRFQVLAVALTYVSVALAYTPIAVKQAMDADRNAQKAATTSSTSHAAEAPDGRRAATTKPSGGRFLLALVFLSAFVAVLPVLVVLGSFPSGLISAFIIFIGMKQAWRMTGAPWCQILGPYRVGAAPVSTPP